MSEVVVRWDVRKTTLAGFLSFIPGQTANTGKGIPFEEKLLSLVLTTLSLKYLGWFQKTTDYKGLKLDKLVAEVDGAKIGEKKVLGTL